MFIPYTVGLKSNFEANWKLKDFADLFSEKIQWITGLSEKYLVPKKIGFDYVSENEKISHIFCPYLK